jgi:hypothetical protein
MVFEASLLSSQMSIFIIIIGCILFQVIQPALNSCAKVVILKSFPKKNKYFLVMILLRIKVIHFFSAVFLFLPEFTNVTPAPSATGSDSV